MHVPLSYNELISEPAASLALKSNKIKDVKKFKRKIHCSQGKSCHFAIHFTIIELLSMHSFSLQYYSQHSQ